MLGAEGEGGKWDAGGLLKVSAVGGEIGGAADVTSGGTEGTGEGATNGNDAEGTTGGRAG